MLVKETGVGYVNFDGRIIKKIFLLILSIALIAVFMGQRTKAKEAQVIKISSNYVDTVECARKIMKEKRPSVMIDENIAVDPVVYEVEMIRKNRDEKAVREFFIKEYTKQAYIQEMSLYYDIQVSEEEISKYIDRMTMNMMKCEREEFAVLGGFSCFNDYINDEGTRSSIINDICMSKLKAIKDAEKEKLELKISKTGVDEGSFVSIDEELASKYLEYMDN